MYRQPSTFYNTDSLKKQVLLNWATNFKLFECASDVLYKCDKFTILFYSILPGAKSNGMLAHIQYRNLVQ